MDKAIRNQMIRDLICADWDMVYNDTISTDKMNPIQKQMYDFMTSQVGYGLDQWSDWIKTYPGKAAVDIWERLEDDQLFEEYRDQFLALDGADQFHAEVERGTAPHETEDWSNRAPGPEEDNSNPMDDPRGHEVLGMFGSTDHGLLEDLALEAMGPDEELSFSRSMTQEEVEMMHDQMDQR